MRRRRRTRERSKRGWEGGGIRQGFFQIAPAIVWVFDVFYGFLC